MEETADRAIAIVGLGAVLPDAPNVAAFWENVKSGRYSISDVSRDRWDPELYYDPDPSVPDKTYSKIGGWVREHHWDPMKWRLAIPPRVVDAMDEGQRWAISCTFEALHDFGYPDRAIDLERTAVILGNAMAGEKHYLTALRLHFPEYAHELAESESFAALPESVRRDITRELHQRIARRVPDVTEDTMPGELSNCIAGRIANIFNLHGPNYVVDAACASAMAAITAGVEGLIERDFDVAITGGIDRNMGATSFIKFCKIGALSATGTRPYAEGADGFVMGEGAAIFLLKRLADAERAGDKIHAVVRGIAGSSDGKGKGITAPNPIGQKICIERAWEKAGVSPATATYVEGHGTSTRVGDVVEVESLAEVLGRYETPRGAVALGSVKSNIGHLKGAAGAAGVLKTVLALRDKVLPPSIHCEHRNPDIDFAHLPLYVNTELKPWPIKDGDVRRAGVSAFGFGGTNFHTVLEEYVPHRLNGKGNGSKRASVPAGGDVKKTPLRGALLIGAPNEAALIDRLRAVQKEAEAGRAPAPAAPRKADLLAAERLAIDYADAADLAHKAAKVLKAFASNKAVVWRALRSGGVFRGRGAAPKVAFLYTGQGSQYVNMLASLRAREPVVAETFAEADRVMAPLLGKPLSEFVFVEHGNGPAVAKAEEDLRQTAITQPAVLATDIALTRLLAAYGIRPDMTMGHSLGEYGALVASEALPFGDALEAVSARGREMTRVSIDDNGEMAAVSAPLEEIERILESIDGYVVIANINSNTQAVIGGSSNAVERAMAAFDEAGYSAVRLQVSHAFHTSIVAPASEPLRVVLERLRLESPRVPVVANVNGEFYPTGPDVVPQMVDILARQVATPVQFVKGLETLYNAGARVFVEVGPKKALHGFVEDVLGENDDVVALFTNHPKVGDIVAFNQALCGLYAAGLGAGVDEASVALQDPQAADPRLDLPVAITGAALGLPGTERIFDDANIGRILQGEQFIDAIPMRYRRAMLDKHITRLVKTDNGGPTFESIDKLSDVIKLAARGGAFDLETEFGVPAERTAALDRVTRLAIAAGIDALRDAGIPLVMRYKTTTKGTQLPDRWGLPDALRDDTGIIFASAFPGYDSLVGELTRYHEDLARREQLQVLEDLRARAASPAVLEEIDRRLEDLRAALEREPFSFDRRFLLRVLSMGHSQFAELIGARGPNTQINAACASTAQAVALAEDWIRAGRARRVIVISADDVTSNNLMEWIGAGFLASGAAATDEAVEDAALPFDRRRHGLIIGMGAAALVVESPEAARERGIQPICEVLASVTANSAFHGTRLDIGHISGLMEELISQAETRCGIQRREIAPRTVFVSHETYTPARGGSASAEIYALRHVFGDVADQIVITNTKGFTGHAMATGIEEVVAVKTLETGQVPPVANFKEVDPELGPLNLSKGGTYPIEYALRLGAGFGSQISLMLFRRVPAKDGVRHGAGRLGYSYRIADAAAWNSWLSNVAGQAAPKLEVAQHTLRVKNAAARVENGRVEPKAVPIAQATPAPVVKQAPAVMRPPEVKPELIATFVPPEDDAKQRVLALVSQKTGYPEDMLDLDLDLEADLGIDTVKQAEVFAAIREAYGIPRDDQLKLRDYPTLNHVIRFVHERRQVAEPVSGPTPAPAAAVPKVGDEIKERVLELVVEKTGYPKDMLDLDLDLEADLGIDTVKQAEMFAAIREIYGIPRDPNLKLRDFPTLAHVIQFASDRQQAAAPPEPVVHAVDAPARPVAASFDTTNQVPRRVPVPNLRPPLEASKSTGVKIGPGSRVVIMPDQAGVADMLGQRLQALGAEVLWIDNAPHADALSEHLKKWLAAGPIQGVYWLAALDVEGNLHNMDLAAWREALRVRVKLFYTTMRALYGQIAGAGTFLVSATRLGGQHGYDPAGAVAPLGGAVTGFTKTYKWERMDALVKAVDFGAEKHHAEIAAILVEETLRDPGAVEIGYKDGQRWTVGLEEQPAVDGQPGMPLGKDTVFLITGAAGSIVSAITADLAAASGGTFYLLDLVEEPDPNDSDLKRFVSDKEGLKRDLFARIQARGERATPALVEKELAALEREQAALAAIEAVRSAGGTAYYSSVNLTDAGAVAKVISQVRQQNGRIDVLLHAAGMERSHLLPDKEPREFDLVFDVKADGWFNLLYAIGDMPVGATVAFSSIAGRFGNGGQADYAAANDLLSKITSSFRTTRPAMRPIAIDWTAWGGIGMATRGSIPKMMELAGIDMLAPEAGVPLIRRELTAGGTRGEIVVAQRLGIMLHEWDVNGGLDTVAAEERATVRGPMTGKVVTASLHHGLTMEVTLDPAVQPFLHDHQIDGTPVLPGVMGIEAFAEAARWMLPGFRIEAVEDVNFLAPFKFYRSEPRTVTIQATFSPQGDRIVADCRLIGHRPLPNQAEPQETTHFTARVRLVAGGECAGCRQARKTAAYPTNVSEANGRVVEAADIYRVYFHGPAYQVLDGVWADGNRVVGRMAEGLPANHHPPEQATVMAPRLIELCFQTAGLWEIGARGTLGLPRHIDSVSLERSTEAADGRLFAIVTPHADRGAFDAEVVDVSGNRYLELKGYGTVTLQSGVDAEPMRVLDSAAV